MILIPSKIAARRDVGEAIAPLGPRVPAMDLPVGESLDESAAFLCELRAGRSVYLEMGPSAGPPPESC